MRQLLTKLGFFIVLVVMIFSTAQLVYATHRGIECCHHDASTYDEKEQSKHQSCSNEGNPFQFCSCCPHAWTPTHIVVYFEPSTYPPAKVFIVHKESSLPKVISSEFWQPPRLA